MRKSLEGERKSSPNIFLKSRRNFIEAFKPFLLPLGVSFVFSMNFNPERTDKFQKIKDLREKSF